jgi:copper chaperone CopZ
MEKICFKVPGMMCMHCVASVTDALNGIDGISELKVDLSSKTVEFLGDADSKAAAIDAIDTIGFDVE